MKRPQAPAKGKKKRSSNVIDTAMLQAANARVDTQVTQPRDSSSANLRTSSHDSNSTVMSTMSNKPLLAPASTSISLAASTESVPLSVPLSGSDKDSVPAAADKTDDQTGSTPLKRTTPHPLLRSGTAQLLVTGASGFLSVVAANDGPKIHLSRLYLEPDQASVHEEDVEAQSGPNESRQQRFVRYLKHYFVKFKGHPNTPHEIIPPWDELVMSFLVTCVGIGSLALISQYKVDDSSDLVLIMPPFGASAVLVFGAINSPFAQPRNFVGGHLISAFVGVCWAQIFEQTQLGRELLWIPMFLAVSTAIVAMQITKTVHPPGGATALTAVIGSARITALGFMYVLVPALSGALFLLCIVILFNNLSPRRHYPQRWN